jgi:NADP-dependent 3-hydroxy acid dehydrogenase YdfG
MKESKGMIAVITGCSSGIGRELAEALEGAGYTVVATARRPESLASVKATRKLALDVTDEGSVRMAVEAVLGAFGKIDVWINNAGIGIGAAVEELDDDSLRSMLEVNLLGTLRCVRAVAPHMRGQGRGAIINISSIAGTWASPVGGGYSASKFAVEGLSDAARQELAGFGVKVVVVEPGPVRTAFLDRMNERSRPVAGDPSSPYRLLYRQHEALMEASRKTMPGPGAVSKVVLRILNTARPKPRYKAGVGFPLSILLRMREPLRDRVYASSLRDAAVE